MLSMKSTARPHRARLATRGVVISIILLSLAVAAASAAKKPVKAAPGKVTPATLEPDREGTERPDTSSATIIAPKSGEGIVARPGRGTALPLWRAPEHYSVDMVCKTGDQEVVLKRFIDGARIRTDIDAEGQAVSMIELGDEAGTMLTVLPEQKQVMKQTRKGMMDAVPAARASLEKHTGEPPPEGKIEFLGHEKIEGKECDKYRYEAAGQTALAWIDPTNQAPVKMQSKDATVMWKNYRVAPQPEKLFEAPKDYTVMDMDEMMKSMKSMGGWRECPGCPEWE